MSKIYDEAREVALEVIEKAELGEGDVLAIGCSTSVVVGETIGTHSSFETAQELFRGIYDVASERGIYIAAQCCEHLNRALIVEKELLDQPVSSYRPNVFGDVVAVVPQPKAGGSFATTAWQTFKEPVAIETIQADAGIDIGGTLVGMHIKRVAVPVKLQHKTIGEANVIAAGSRAKFIGGERAKYE